MSLSGVLRRVGPKQVFPIFFGTKKVVQEKKNDATFRGLPKGISGQKMNDF